MMQIAQQQAQPALVGTSLPRQDGPDKVTGRARYAGDQTLPGMLYARLVTSPYAHALILNIDTSAALSVPGVVAVFTSEMLGMADVSSSMDIKIGSPSSSATCMDVAVAFSVAFSFTTRTDRFGGLAGTWSHNFHPAVADLVPSDIEVRRNLMTKRLSWQAARVPT